MEQRQLFGSSGIRDKVSRELLQLMLRVGASVGSSYCPVVLGYDTRTSSEAMKHSLISGLLAAGSKVYDAGIIPTPTLGYAARNFAAAVMITASHNPPEYNGVKLLNPDGSAFDSGQQNQIELVIQRDSLELAPWHEMEKCLPFNMAVEEHVSRILEDFDNELRLKVVIDCGCGAASLVSPYLLERLGCEIIAINCYPSGFFPRGIEPVPENLTYLIDIVRAVKADIGMAYDGDGDRIVVIDEKGRVIPGDKLLIIFARELGAKRVVTTQEASMIIDEAGFEVTRTKVGDPFVSVALKGGGDFGGEPSGCWFFPKLSLCPDAIHATAWAVKIASETKLSSLVDNIPSYPILRGSVPAEKTIMAKVEERLVSSTNPPLVIKIDGIRLTFEDGWLLIRPSGTELKIRVTAEARSQQRVKELYNWGIQAIKDCSRE